METIGELEMIDYLVRYSKGEGSLLIVDWTSTSQSPTIGDTWLLRRTWKEMVTLRGW